MRAIRVIIVVYGYLGSYTPLAYLLRLLGSLGLLGLLGEVDKKNIVSGEKNQKNKKFSKILSVIRVIGLLGLLGWLACIWHDLCTIHVWYTYLRLLGSYGSVGLLGILSKISHFITFFFSLSAENPKIFKVNLKFFESYFCELICIWGARTYVSHVILITNIFHSHYIHNPPQSTAQAPQAPSRRHQAPKSAACGCPRRRQSPLTAGRLAARRAAHLNM